MDRNETSAIYRAHATARLKGDTAEAARLAAQLGPEKQMPHLLFQYSLFTEIVFEHLGDRPDPTDLAELTKCLHDRHFTGVGTFNALRAEAMVRAVCGESILLTEIPFGDQAAYMWAVMNELAGPELSDEDLATLFTRADEAGLVSLAEAFGSTIRTQPAPGPAPESESAPEPTAAEEASA